MVNIPPEVKHWHGAAKDSWFQHLAVEVPAEGASNEWLEFLPEEEYNKLPNTDYIMNNTFWVGVHPALGNEEINKISDTIKQFVDERR